MKSKIAGCTHHTSKVLKMAGGGSVPGKLKTMGPPNVKEIQKKTDKNPDGSQQYVRGTTPMDRINTLSEYQNKSYSDVEKSYRSGDKANSSKSLRGATMLDKAQQVEAKKELARRKRK